MIRPGLPSLATPATALAGGHRTHRPEVPQGEPYGLALWYSVLVPDLSEGRQSLGSWSGCSGLEVRFAPDGPFDEGGAVAPVRYLPGKVSYGNVTLERAMTERGTRKVRAWLEGQLRDWANGGAREGGGQEIVVELHSGPGRAGRIATWALKGAIPVAWTIPPFSATGGVAVERLTIAHTGFLGKPEPQQQLELIEHGAPGNKLDFLFNPSRIALSQSREAEARHTTTLAEPPVVDPDTLKVSVPELRVEGVRQVQRASELLRRWVLLAPAPRTRPTMPSPPTDPPPTCRTCQQRLPSARAARDGAGVRVLSAVWGTARGGLPPALVLKSFDLNITRFTPAGEPCRATIQLILQEHRGPVRG